MIDPNAFPPTYREASETVIVTASAHSLAHSPIAFGSIIVKSAMGAILVAGIDYTVSYTAGTITWLTPIIGSEVGVTYRYNATPALLQDGIDYIQTALGESVATLDAQSIGGIITIADARTIESVERLNCGCVTPFCACEGKPCFDWQWNAPTLTVADDDDYRVCYLPQLTTATAPANWTGCLRVYLLAEAQVTTTGGTLRSEQYGFGDESVQLTYSDKESINQLGRLSQCIRALQRGKRFGTRHRGVLPCH